MSIKKVQDRAVDFTSYLEGLVDKDNRGALADLRKGLADPPGMTFEMYRYIVPHVEGIKSRWEVNVYYLVATLFAWHQIAWHPSEDQKFSNLGTSLRELIPPESEEKDESEKKMEPLERHFIALLNCHCDDLHEHLKQLFGLLKGKGIAVDYVRLIKDLVNWDRERWHVPQNWANEFWKGNKNTSIHNK